jgi:hypothetical protein
VETVATTFSQRSGQKWKFHPPRSGLVQLVIMLTGAGLYIIAPVGILRVPGQHITAAGLYIGVFNLAAGGLSTDLAFFSGGLPFLFTTVHKSVASDSSHDQGAP